jgi:hypothetical protein
MYRLPTRQTLWSRHVAARHVADRLDRLTTDRRLGSRAELPAVLGLR